MYYWCSLLEGYLKIQFLGIYPVEIFILLHKAICPVMHILALFMIAEVVKNYLL